MPTEGHRGDRGCRRGLWCTGAPGDPDIAPGATSSESEAREPRSLRSIEVSESEAEG